MTSADPQDLARWRRYLADERAEEKVYRELAARKSGEDREILLGLADAEARHAQYWLSLLGDEVGAPTRPDWRTRLLIQLARRFGSVFVLALAQRAEARSPYDTERHAPASMVADEHVHEEVLRALAGRGRARLSGTFRAAVFGANDGLVSNLALVLGIIGTGVDRHFILVTGLAGLLAGALSMGAGEYVSVRSQRELLEASAPSGEMTRVAPDLDVSANELALVYRARGMDEESAKARAEQVISRRSAGETELVPSHEEIGTGIKAATSSFLFFSSGAIIPVLPYLLGLGGLPAGLVAIVLVGIALLSTGFVVGIFSGGPPFRRALRQLAIGYGAAAATFLLGLLFGTGGV